MTIPFLDRINFLRYNDGNLNKEVNKMADFEQEDLDMDESVVVMTDEEGNEYYYREDMIIPVSDKRFAILVELLDEECCGEEDCECESDEIDIFIARIDTEDGEDVYVDPTDDEFETVRQLYEKMVAEEEEMEE